MATLTPSLRRGWAGFLGTGEEVPEHVLTVGDLTGHRLIAATGALGPGGSVDPVLAYDAKVDASARAGANFFLMPRADIPTVEPFARGRTNLVGVSSVKEAVLWLCANGGMSSVCAR